MTKDLYYMLQFQNFTSFIWVLDALLGAAQMISCLKTGCKNFWNQFLVRAQKAGAEVIGVACNLESFPGVGRKGMCQHCAFSACSLTSYPHLLQSSFMNLTWWMMWSRTLSNQAELHVVDQELLFWNIVSSVYVTTNICYQLLQIWGHVNYLKNLWWIFLSRLAD